MSLNPDSSTYELQKVNLSTPQFPHLENENGSAYLKGFHNGCYKST